MEAGVSKGKYLTYYELLDQNLLFNIRVEYKQTQYFYLTIISQPAIFVIQSSYTILNQGALFIDIFESIKFKTGQ